MKIGDKVGRLTILRKSSYKNRSGNYIYKCECRCDCGNVVTVFETNLRKGKTSSCGCLYEESRHTITLTHGQRETRLYSIWTNMKTRCTNSNSPNYEDYGKKGISICNKWFDNFENFAEWSYNNGYSDNLSIDRIDVYGNYEPNNCRWSDKFIQARNKTNNLLIEINNQVRCLKEWCILYSLPYKSIHRKIRKSTKAPEVILQWYLNRIIKVKETV